MFDLGEGWGGFIWESAFVSIEFEEISWEDAYSALEAWETKWDTLWAVSWTEDNSECSNRISQ